MLENILRGNKCQANSFGSSPCPKKTNTNTDTNPRSMTMTKTNNVSKEKTHLEAVHVLKWLMDALRLIYHFLTINININITTIMIILINTMQWG